MFKNLVLSSFLASSLQAQLLELDLKTSHDQRDAAVALQLAQFNGLPYIEKDLDNYMDVQLYSTVYIGSEKQPFDLIFDSGSSWIWVSHETCDMCFNMNRYDPFTSVSWETQQHDLKATGYGSGLMVGAMGRDSVCLTPDICADNVQMMTAFKVKGLEFIKASGIMGLAPESLGAGSELVLGTLYEQGKIHQNVFAIAYDENEDSKIQFGGYDLSKYSDEDATFHYTISDSQWYINLDSVSIGAENFDLQTRATKALVDTGASAIIAPDADYQTLQDYIAAHVDGGIQWDNSQSLAMGQCTKSQFNQIPDLYVTIDGHKYTIPRDTYVKYQAGTCTLWIMHGFDSTQWSLGVSFFHNYVTIFDAGNKQIGFAQSNRSYIPKPMMLSQTGQAILDLSSEYLGTQNYSDKLAQTLAGLLILINVTLTAYYLKQKRDLKIEDNLIQQYVSLQGQVINQSAN